MLDLTIGNDPAGFSLGEVVNWFQPYRTHHFDIKCGCGVYPCPVWKNLKDLTKNEFHEKALESLGVDFLVDSSKNLPWIIDNNLKGIKSKKYQPINILVYKDPISLYYSFWKRGYKNLSILINAYNDYNFFLKSRLPFISINYDRYLSDYKNQLQKLCKILEIPYFENKYKFWEKTHHHLFGSFGVRKQLFSNNPEIYKEEYQENFLLQKKNIEKQVETDTPLRTIYETLKKNDIQELTAYPFPAKTQIKKGYNFYYKSKIKRYYKKFKPIQYPDKEAKLIHTFKF